MAFIVLAFLLLGANAVQGRLDEYALKQHVGFFDRDQDGIIHVSETVEGFKALGSGAVEATSFASAIHARLSSKTLPRVQAGAFGSGLPIMVENIKLAKHSCDTGVFDYEGRFVPEKFQEIFTKYARKKPNALDSSELNEMLNANRKSGDYGNWLSATAEWKLLYRLGKDEDGFLTSYHVRNVYDGSFFHQLAKNISTSSSSTHDTRA